LLTKRRALSRTDSVDLLKREIKKKNLEVGRLSGRRSSVTRFAADRCDAPKQRQGAWM
jgi:hypothetical protein